MRDKRERDKQNIEEGDKLQEKVVKIRRVNKVVKGGKRLAFSSFVIVGDGKGKVGLAVAKSKEVPMSIKKAMERAKKAMVSIKMDKTTIPHQIIGEFGASRVLLRPARPGTGVIAGGSVRILLELLGIKDIVAKSLGSNNPINSAKAALSGLLALKTKAVS